MFNVTYYPVFRNLKSQLKEFFVILQCDEDHKKVFSGVPVIGLFPGVPVIGFMDIRT